MNETLFPNIFPALIYRDADAALDFLKSAFGAEEKAVHRDDAGKIHHAELRLGAGIVMLGEYAEDRWMGAEPPRAAASPIGLYIVVGDPDAHYARATAAGAVVVRELVDQPYGSREYSALDPEGNRWSFGTYDPYSS
jgi:uncharacterized glyoxalase superfamily protein PhnB